MTGDAAGHSRIDHLATRVVALALALCGLALMAWIGLFGFAGVALTPFENMAPDGVKAASGNPALQACLEERVGAVDAMRREGVISDTQYDAFRTRAVDYCQAENPTPP